MIEVSGRLGLPPVPTYSGQTLWNHRRLGDVKGPMIPENIQTLISFTGSPEESFFFGISVAIEACGAPLVSTLLEGIEAVRNERPDELTVYLQESARMLAEMTSLLAHMYQKCSPEFFYFTLRPFLEGTRDLASVGLADGVFFEERSGGRYLKYRGPSNAQSSMFAFLDICLGVSHYKKERLAPEEDSLRGSKTARPENEFLEVSELGIIELWH